MQFLHGDTPLKPTQTARPKVAFIHGTAQVGLCKVYGQRFIGWTFTQVSDNISQ